MVNKLLITAPTAAVDALVLTLVLVPVPCSAAKPVDPPGRTADHWQQVRLFEGELFRLLQRRARVHV